MKLTNNEIYSRALSLAQFNELDIYIPVKANFKIQKNITTLTAAAQDIEKARVKIAEHFGNKEDDCFNIPEDKRAEAAEELNNLSNLEQDLDIETFSLEDLGDIQLKPSIMQSIMFMIKD